MAFKKPTVKRSAIDISQITGFIMGVRKFGKTSLWADLIREKFKDPEKGLLVSCGMEHGTNMIDNVNTTHINTYKELEELKTWLMTEKGKEHDIKMICFDSAEELFSILEKEIVRRSNIENPTKKCKSIKAAYSGFTNGEKECAKLAKEIFNELYNVGIMPWSIGHTKLKTVRDKSSLDEEGFQKLGSSLISDYEAAIADCFDIIVTGIVDREIEERGSGDNVKRYVKETERRLYFRGNEIVEAGGRLKGLSVPEYIPFDQMNMGKTFIDTVEAALKAGRVDSDVVVKPVAAKPAPVVEEEPTIVSDPLPADFETDDDLFEAEADYPENLEEAVTTMFKACKDTAIRAEVRDIIKAHGKIQDCDLTTLQELYDRLK